VSGVMPLNPVLRVGSCRAEEGAREGRGWEMPWARGFASMFQGGMDAPG